MKNNNLTKKQKRSRSALIPENKKPWFYDKHGNVSLRKFYPTNIDGEINTEKPMTYCGALHDSVGFCMRSNKVNNLKNHKP